MPGDTLAAVGIDAPYWLTDSSTALTNAWHLTPMAILVFYAALTTIPEELYEAAPGMIGGMLASEIGAGFIGGILAGFLAGYVAKAVAVEAQA